MRTVPHLASGVLALYAGSCALKSADKIVCWGDNEYGRLGLDPNLDLDGNYEELVPTPQPMLVFKP